MIKWLFSKLAKYLIIKQCSQIKKNISHYFKHYTVYVDTGHMFINKLIRLYLQRNQLQYYFIITKFNYHHILLELHFQKLIRFYNILFSLKLFLFLLNK